MAISFRAFANAKHKFLLGDSDGELPIHFWTTISTGKGEKTSEMSIVLGMAQVFWISFFSFFSFKCEQNDWIWVQCSRIKCLSCFLSLLKIEQVRDEEVGIRTG